ncbi:hypothetical protein ACOJUR_09735 [Alicyclobacillus tolerans]|uniref:Uncharacterized protein n=2 Tax=Alicyclobacillus tolerans TaxID=90970 RepID=A0ABT9M039_9BACL|nr:MULTISPECIES: hypothetical protein [Alicyclobacillus]MDP9729856.1 hypothetical protein [Alicyclobacillus tengchongensis]SHL03260.1 hypothetical protein SAMN05443507_1336 [Alicyclobacillus montanus]
MTKEQNFSASPNSALPENETYQDSVLDAIDRLQEDGGVSPEISHRPPQHKVRIPKEK